MTISPELVGFLGLTATVVFYLSKVSAWQGRVDAFVTLAQAERVENRAKLDKIPILETRLERVENTIFSADRYTNGKSHDDA